MTNPHPLTEVEVTQADREAAAALGLLINRTLAEARDMRRAGADQDEIVQAFARHRLSTSAQPSTEAVKLADKLERLYSNYTKPTATTADTFALRSHMVAHFPEILAALRQSPPLPSIDEVERAAKFWHRIGYATCWADATANKLPDEGLLSDAIDHAWSVRHETYEGDLDADAALMRVDAPKGLDDG